MAADSPQSTVDRRQVLALNVPFLTQTKDLCGGAAVAMVYRFWGDVHAGARQFEPLIDRRSGGIATTEIVAAVRHAGWEATEFAGSLNRLREELSVGQPVIVLLSEPGNRFHYVVVTGIGPDAVRVHDPSWGASRRLALSDLVRRWEAARFWALKIVPGERRAMLLGDARTNSSPQGTRRIQPGKSFPAAESLSADRRECDQALAGAIDHVRTHGLESADEIIAPVRASCPTDAGPLRELAGVRFAQKRWRQAAALAEQATTIDPNDAYAWDLLGASRFVLDEGVAALQAWNHVGKPIVDSVQIAGNERTRQALLVERLGIPSESILTPDLFSRARRRFEALPDRSTGRVGFRPQQDGFANVDVVMAELPTIPRGVFGWVAEGARTAIDREVRMDLPGGGGQGQVWSGAWRWWDGQPRVSVAFTAPRAGKLPGVWRVEGAWEAQTFAAAPAESRPTREEWTHGGVQVSDWLTGSVQYHAQVGLDSWNDHHAAVSVGGGIERRLLSDRISLAADVSTWMPVSEQVAFYRTGVRATYASSADAAGTVFLAQAGTSVVTAGAPMTVWPGAGDGHGREPLLRAHPLLHDGLLEGPVFGRRVSYATTETRRWLPSRLPLGIAVAGFVDSAYAAQRAPAASHDAFQLDAGVGARIKIPGRRGVLRIDFGHGLRDGAHAISAAWLP